MAAFATNERRLLASLLATTILLAARSARADAETEGERLFREGRAAMLDGRFDEACAMLAESQRVEPHTGTLLNLAACDERRGKIGSAWVEYQKALTAARAEGQIDRVKLAEQRLAVIEPRVPWLRVSSASAAGPDLVITLDGGELARVAWGTEMPIDPGAHQIVATRGGAKVFEERIEIREGERRSVAVVLPSTPPPLGAPASETLVVEPKPAATAASPKALGRWILEPGIFVGYVGGSTKYPRIDRVALRSQASGGQPSTCGSQTCSVDDLDAGSAAFGVSFFGGYAVSEPVALGLRVLGAPSIGSKGAGFFAFGPSVVLRASSALSIGAFVGFGDASFTGTVRVTPPSGYSLESTSPVRAEGTLAGGPVVGVDVSLTIAELPRGSIVATAMPLFLAGSSGNAFVLPVGLAYRFQ